MKFSAAPWLERVSCVKLRGEEFTFGYETQLLNIDAQF